MVPIHNGLVHPGNLSRLKATMNRSADEPVTVAFIGGSITQGSLASAEECCYAHRIYRWWQNRFPNSRYINAGIGGTDSQFGVARVEEDVLRFRPDVVFVEFSVNDENTPHFRETYEGLVRKILRSGAAVVLIHNMFYDSGKSAEEMHLEIGKHYDLPCISMKSAVFSAVKEGRLQRRALTPDDLHPNDRGHALVASVVTGFLDRVSSADIPVLPTDLPKPLTANGYEYSFRHQNHNAAPVLEGFLPDPTPQEHITQMFRRGYTARNRGDKITFLVEGTGIAVQYRKSVRQPAPIAKVTVDGVHSCFLDANFRETWGDCLYLESVLIHGEDKPHRVVIEITESHENDAVPFYLVSVIGSR